MNIPNISQFLPGNFNTKNVSNNEKKNHKARNIVLMIAGVLVAIIIACAIAYASIANMYEGKFLPNTTIQGIDVSKMTAADAFSTISADFSSVEVSIKEIGQDDITIKGEDISLAADRSRIEEMLKEQNKWDWLSSTFCGKDYDDAGVTYDMGKIGAIANNLDCVSGKNRLDPLNAHVEYDVASDAFTANNAQVGNKVSAATMQKKLTDKMISGGGIIDVVDLYTLPQYTSDSPEIKDIIDTAERWASRNISYNIDGIDDAEKLSREKIIEFIVLNNDEMKVELSDEKIAGWLKEIGKAYDTAGQEIRYTTVYGKDAVLPGGSYGWITDEQAMLPIVKTNITEGKTVDVSSTDDNSNDEVIAPQDASIPALNDDVDSNVDQDFKYQQECNAPKGQVDWGNRYVDLDISEQKVRLVENGNVIHEFVTVTGKDDGRHNTPLGAWKIDMKAMDYVMVGSDENNDGKPDYVTPAKYFVHFKNGCAFHDATWRSNWTTTAWRQGGSHGCANMKMADVTELFNFVEIGTPVLVHM